MIKCQRIFKYKFNWFHWKYLRIFTLICGICAWHIWANNEIMTKYWSNYFCNNANIRVNKSFFNKYFWINSFTSIIFALFFKLFVSFVNITALGLIWPHFTDEIRWKFPEISQVVLELSRNLSRFEKILQKFSKNARIWQKKCLNMGQARRILKKNQKLGLPETFDGWTRLSRLKASIPGFPCTEHHPISLYQSSD